MFKSEEGRRASWLGLMAALFKTIREDGGGTISFDKFLHLRGEASRSILGLLRRRGGRASARAVAMRATGIAINGFGYIGRQMAHIAMQDPEAGLKLINASSGAECLAIPSTAGTLAPPFPMVTPW